jgi:hypothetical protein
VYRVKFGGPLPFDGVAVTTSGDAGRIVYEGYANRAGTGYWNYEFSNDGSNEFDQGAGEGGKAPVVEALDFEVIFNKESKTGVEWFVSSGAV